MRSNTLVHLYQSLANLHPHRGGISVKPKLPSAYESRPRLMAVLAHPDDEALCIGGTLAAYAAQGVEIALVVATRGERGWRGEPAANPGLRRMGEIRESELKRSARLLGVSRLELLNYIDGDVDAAPQQELVSRIALAVRRFRPDIVVTFDPHGMYGHPDHIAISQATTNALWHAADPNFEGAKEGSAHRVSKLYYRVYSPRAIEQYQSVFGKLEMEIRGENRIASAWHNWAVTTQIDVKAHKAQVWNAIACHTSQIQATALLRQRFFHAHLGEFGNETYYRVFSIVNGVRLPETDLFEGLRVASHLASLSPGEPHA